MNESSANQSESFTVSLEGNFVGQDGFVVPKDFSEFYARNPNYVRRWTVKRLRLTAHSDAVQDLEQDLLLYLCCLPEQSKFREPSESHPQGRQDVIQCFDPSRQYGASERRWRSWLNMCLSNRASTIYSHQKKNPVYRKDNIRFEAWSESEDIGGPDDEYIHAHSEMLRRISNWESSNVEQKLLVKRFTEFVLEKEPRLYDTVLAIAESGTSLDARNTLQADDATFAHDLRRVIQLKDAFIDGGPIPRQRKPYKKRTDTATRSHQLLKNETASASEHRRRFARLRPTSHQKGSWALKR